MNGFWNIGSRSSCVVIEGWATLRVVSGVTVTERLVRAGELLGIPLLDHVVLGGERHVSLAAEGHRARAEGQLNLPLGHQGVEAVGPAVQLGDASGEGQAQSHSLWAGRGEGMKQAVLDCRIDPGALVFHSDGTGQSRGFQAEYKFINQSEGRSPTL